ncbi:MAG TPA: VWA domain-containing protein [Planctomycetota bacterium]|nr:VWA domain-containing protein [Planctomycetota bacterium]
MIAAQAQRIVETSQVSFLALPPVWVLVLVALPALLLFLRWLYRRERVEGQRWIPAGLRGLTLALLALFLMHPVRLTQKVAIERPVAAVLLDDSASMRERDLPRLARELGLPEQSTRSEVLRAQLGPPLAALQERYELLTFAFGDTLRAVGSLDDLAAADGSTRLGDALAALVAETRGRELSQVIVVSDGKSNAGRDPQAALSALLGRSVSVHAIGVGDPDVPPDLRVAGVTVPEVALVGDTVTLEVAIAARGFPGQPASLTLTDASSGEELARQDFSLADAPGTTEQVVRIGFLPEREGDLELDIRVPPRKEERDQANNTERRLLRVEPGRIKVLYVDGYARYEYRFLKDSLLRFSNVEAQCLLLDASPEFIQESTEGVPALTRFPYDASRPDENQLLAYHVVIFGDVHPADLGSDPDRILQQVKEFVEAGGGFLLQAGTRDAPREYAGTPVADILPVLLGDAETEWAAVDEGEFHPVLERPRDPHEVVTLHPDLDTNRMLWESEDGLAPLTWYHPVAQARATAEVLLRHPRSRNANGPHVLLATMYYPQGRTAYLAPDETWRWRFRFLETYREPFWKNLIRYLALNKLRRSDYRFDLSTDLGHYDIGERVAVTARVRGADFRPLEGPLVPVQLVRPDGRRETLSAERQDEGVFAGGFVATEPGSYRLWLEDPDAPDTGPRSPRIITASVPSAETDDPLLDEALLAGLAAAAGGRYEPLARAPGLLGSLADPVRERPLDEPERAELWAGYPQLLLLVGLLAAEWFVRKRGNLV